MISARSKTSLFIALSPSISCESPSSRSMMSWSWAMPRSTSASECVLVVYFPSDVRLVCCACCAAESCSVIHGKCPGQHSSGVADDRLVLIECVCNWEEQVQTVLMPSSLSNGLFPRRYEYFLQLALLLEPVRVVIRIGSNNKASCRKYSYQIGRAHV